MYWYVFSLVEDLEDINILNDLIDNEPDGDNTKIEDPATEIIGQDQNPKLERVQKRGRRPKTKGR